MKKMSLMALLVGAALFTGLGATSAMAGENGKCGAGKCGTAKSMTKGKCGNVTKPCKCGAAKGMMKGKCGNATKPGKCGGERKAPAKGKCGAGKCG